VHGNEDVVGAGVDGVARPSVDRRDLRTFRPSRRTVLRAAALLPLMGATACAQRGNGSADAGAKLDRGALTIPLGDSIDGASDVEGSYSAGSIYSTLCIQSQQRVMSLYNAGVREQTTAQCRDRLQADVIDRKPGICIIGGGVTNDHGDGVAASVTRENLAAMATALKTAGIRVVMRLCPPCSVSGGVPFDTAASRSAEIQRHNAWATGWAGARDIPVLDYYSPLVDENNGGYAPGLSDDGIHPTIGAQRTVVDYLLKAGLPDVFNGKVALVSSVGDGTDLLGGAGLFLGKPTRGVADGWSHYGNNAELSVVPDPSPGNLQTIEGGSSSQHVIESPVLTDGFALGDTIGFAFRIIKDDRASSYVRLRYGDDGKLDGEVSPAAGQRSLDGIAAGRVVLPVGTRQLQVQIAVEAGAKLQVGRITVSNLTALGSA
jgi:lysophospholipase L1-like esterase